MLIAEAFCPSGISSFFEVCTTDPRAHRILDPAKVGARGGGFGIARGVRARVQVSNSSRARVKVRINSHPTTDARTTVWALAKLMKQARQRNEVSVDLTIRVPVGAGYGMSAAGTLATCLAYSEAANLPYSFNELGRLTHVAEVVNQTGLGTASALLEGGFILVTEPGAPGVGSVDRLGFPSDHSIVCAYVRPIPTKKVLSQRRIADRVNPAAQRTIRAIRKRPNLDTFLLSAERFSVLAGLRTPEVSTLIRCAKAAGAVGALQNMLGEAVHAVVPNSRIKSVMRALRRSSPSAQVFYSPLDYRGVRLL